MRTWRPIDKKVKMSQAEEFDILTKQFGMSESEVREMQAIECGDIDGDVVAIPIDPDLKTTVQAA